VERKFGRFGRVAEVRIVRDFSGKSRGFGFVAFDTEEAARAVRVSYVNRLGSILQGEL
jgi:RNA recognition motif-containing protein